MGGILQAEIPYPVFWQVIWEGNLKIEKISQGISHALYSIIFVLKGGKLAKSHPQNVSINNHVAPCRK